MNKKISKKGKYKEHNSIKTNNKKHKDPLKWTVELQKFDHEI